MFLYYPKCLLQWSNPDKSGHCIQPKLYNQRQIPAALSPFEGIVFHIFPSHPCVLLFSVRGCGMTVLCCFHMFLIYICSTISGASIFYPAYQFFIRRECCVTQAYCCFGSVDVFGENITLDPFTCSWLAEGLGWGNRLIFIFGFLLPGSRPLL